jgi:lipoprotein-anchoring transpeptidase ErfK/SrfK
MTKSNISLRRSTLYPVLIILLICTVIAVAAWTATSSPAMGLKSATTPTHTNSFAFVVITKPTYTPSPPVISIPVEIVDPTTTAPSTVISSPSVQPTNTPEQLVIAEIVADAPSSVYTAPNQMASSGYSGNKRILVDISEQHMYVYEGDVLVYSFVASTGMHNATRVGTFSVLDKIPNAYGATWNIWMPNWLGIYYAGSMENGIHALPILPNGATLWAGYLGVPISYGCVVLGTYEAQLLYDWADVGTPVEIQW